MRAFDCVVLMWIVVISLAAGDAGAINAPRRLTGTAASSCQTALPVFDGQVRKRPLSLQNEGASNAFVTCAFTRHFNSRSISGIFVTLTSASDVTHHVSCTLVAGVAGASNNQFITASTDLPPGSLWGVSWPAQLFDGGVFPDTQYSMSCNLPPGFGLNGFELIFSEDIGAA